MSQRKRSVAVYARCSTSRDQNPDVQLMELRQYCHARGWVIRDEIVDHGFTGKSDQRPGLKQLLTLVRSRKVDVVVVVKLDRLFRSLKHMVNLLHELSELEVEFVSLRDQIDLTTAAGRLMLHLIASFAEFERELIVERTYAGIAHARLKGRRLGRPATIPASEIRRLRAEGYSFRRIMKHLGCSMGAVNRALSCDPKSATPTTDSSTGKGSADDGDR